MDEMFARGSVIPPRKLALRELRLVYANTLETYLVEGPEASPRRACDLGRWAIEQGISVLKIATVHHESLGRILIRLSRAISFKDGLRRAGEFLVDALAPYELAHRGSREAVLALRQLNEKLEREMQRISLAVHDEAGQLLYAARLAMSTAAEGAIPPLQQRLAEIGAILNQAEQQLRQVSHDLRPTILDDLGLVPALKFLAEQVSRSTGISVHLKSSVENRFAANIKTALYRIVQEALTNVTRHSLAKNVTIELRREPTKLTCLVQDDGVGFDPGVLWSRGGRGMGLTGIRERTVALGGRLQIHSQPRRGTELLVEIPLKRRSAAGDGQQSNRGHLAPRGDTVDLAIDAGVIPVGQVELPRQPASDAQPSVSANEHAPDPGVGDLIGKESLGAPERVPQGVDVPGSYTQG
jgi:signal transduction histidine kinase